MSKKYPGGIPDPDELGSIPLRHVGAGAGPETRDVADIAGHLGRAVTFIDEDGFENDIIAGAIADEGRKMAWVDSRCKDNGGAVDITFTLRARVGDRPVIDWEVDTYNPYFGCDVQHIGWWDETVVVIYSEKHHTVLAALTEGQLPLVRFIGDQWELREDRVYCRSKVPGLLDVIEVPTLKPRAPLPEDMLAEVGAPCEPLVEPSDQSQLVASVKNAAFGSVSWELETELLIGSQLFPFWTVLPEAGHDYDTPYRDSFSWNLPVWLPLYWHLNTVSDGSSAMISILEQGLAAAPNTDCELTNRALAHLKARSAKLLTACRNAGLPEDAYCYFWMDWSMERFEADIEAFPAGLATCFNTLKADSERWLEVGANRDRRRAKRGTR